MGNQFVGLLIGHLFDLRFFRVFRLSRLLKLSRYTGTLNTLFKAVQREQRVLNTFVDVLRPVLTGFAFLSLFVCAFVIFNTFSVVVTQRFRDTKWPPIHRSAIHAC